MVLFLFPVQSSLNITKPILSYHGPFISPTSLFPPHSVSLTKLIDMFLHIAPQTSVPNEVKSKLQSLNKVKIRTTLKAIIKAHVYMLGETSYNDFSFHQRHSFQLWVVMSPSPKTLAAVGTSALPNDTAGRTSEGSKGQGQIQTPWIHHLVAELARNLPDLAKEG